MNRNVDTPVEAPIDLAPFVENPGDGTGRRFWVPNRDGEHFHQCAVGTGYAWNLLGLLAASDLSDVGRSAMVAQVMQAMVKAGKVSGVEIGFCNTIAELALAAYDALPPPVRR